MTRPLSAGSMTMLLSVFSRFSACCSSFVKLLSGIEADCTGQAILLVMVSSADSFSLTRENRLNTGYNRLGRYPFRRH